MFISNNRVVVEKVEEEVKEGFQEVKVQDSSTFKGRVLFTPEAPIYMGNHPVTKGDVLLFAQNSPDTHMIPYDGKDIKFVMVSDILAVL
jgi:co-chaperonin GroES (HSP10)